MAVDMRGHAVDDLGERCTACGVTRRTVIERGPLRTWTEPGTGRVYPHKDAVRVWAPMDSGYDPENPTEKALRRPKMRVVGEYGWMETIAPENAQAAWRVDIERCALARVPPFCVACGAPLSAVRSVPPRCGVCG